MHTAGVCLSHLVLSLTINQIYSLYVQCYLLYMVHKGGRHVFICLYDLQKAFDSVEYSVLLERLFEVGTNDKL